MAPIRISSRKDWKPRRRVIIRDLKTSELSPEDRHKKGLLEELQLAIYARSWEECHPGDLVVGAGISTIGHLTSHFLETSSRMLELIAGIVETGESDVSVAHREADEEAGCVLGRLEPIATFYPSAGACSEQIRVFVGELMSAKPGTIQGLDSEHEDILVHQLPRQAALTLLDEGAINSGHTLIALHWLARHGERLRAAWLDNNDD